MEKESSAQDCTSLTVYPDKLLGIGSGLMENGFRILLPGEPYEAVLKAIELFECPMACRTMEFRQERATYLKTQSGSNRIIGRPAHLYKEGIYFQKIEVGAEPRVIIDALARCADIIDKRRTELRSVIAFTQKNWQRFPGDNAYMAERIPGFVAALPYLDAWFSNVQAFRTELMQQEDRRIMALVPALSAEERMDIRNPERVDERIRNAQSPEEFFIGTLGEQVDAGALTP